MDRKATVAATAGLRQCVLRRRPERIRPNGIHINARHDHDAVLSDLRRRWPILRPRGMTIMDDYDLATAMWPTVLSAFDASFTVTAHEGLACLPYKCRVRKTLG